MKNKYATIGIILTTLVLAGVAIFTAIKLYQAGNTAVAPNVPSSNPNAAGTMCGGIAGIVCPSGEDCIYSDGTTRAPFPDASGTCRVSSGTGKTINTCQLSFSITTATSTATATATSTSTSSSSPTPTSTATATATANPQCNNSCTSNSNCPSGLMCYIPSGQTAGNCRNTQCLTESDCTCAVATSTSTAVPTQPSLPVVGTSWPTILGTGFGILVIIGSLLLAL